MIVKEEVTKDSNEEPHDVGQEQGQKEVRTTAGKGRHSVERSQDVLVGLLGLAPRLHSC